MELILFGPPGVGKGTQAKRLVQRFDLYHLSTGDIFREAMREETEVGLIAKKYVDLGKLVPDEIVWDIARGALEDIDGGGFILDGYPRTVPQALWLDGYISGQRRRDPIVVVIEVPDEKIVHRLTKRRIDPETGKIYHLEFNPPPDDIPIDRLLHRVDDQIETVQKRLRVYRNQTEPVRNYYEEKGLVKVIDGVGDIDRVFDDIVDAIESSIKDQEA